MSTTPIALLGLAREIYSGGGEHHMRSSISRAYYAAYHGCKTWCEDLPGIASIGGGLEGGVHQNLVNQLQNPAPEVTCPLIRKKSKLLGARVQVFKMHRVKADYFLTEAHPYSDWAANTISGVEQMLAQMQPVGQQAVPSMAPAAEDPQQAYSQAADLVQVVPVAAGAGRPALKRVK